MDYDEKRLFFRSRAGFLTTSFLYTAFFLAAIILQRLLYFEYAQAIISIFLIASNFLITLLFGIPGYWVSTLLTMLQLVLYIYTIVGNYNENIMVLIGLGLLSVLINTMFLMFINRVIGRLDALRTKFNEEKARRINSENAALFTGSVTGKSGTIVRHEDISDKSRYTQAVESSRRVALDPLTTLPNRHMINEHTDVKIFEYNKAFREASEQGKDCGINPIYVIYLTVDDPTRFSPDNGHIIVDLFIQTMAHRLREAADSADFVGRIANNEFAVVTTRLDGDTNVLLYAIELSKALSEECDGRFYAGISQYPRDAMYSGELIQHAESAMYEAIKEDTDAKIYEPLESHRREEFLESKSLSELKVLFDKAFEKNEIYMVYQPRFDASRKLTGFEAFARWDCPGHGTVDTKDFLFYAEKTGHIYALGELSMKQSFKTLAKLNSIDPTLTMTVNFSTTQLHAADIQTDLFDAAKEAGCELKNLIIDIPSDGASVNIAEVQNTLDAFASSGIAMALDNFGRGYSSLSNIPLLPISLVKLDANFTADLEEGSAQDILTHSIISLMSELDISVDATNVSSKEQFDRLVSYGCAFFQGTYLSEPLPEYKLKSYIKNLKD